MPNRKFHRIWWWWSWWWCIDCHTEFFFRIEVCYLCFGYLLLLTHSFAHERRALSRSPHSLKLFYFDVFKSKIYFDYTFFGVLSMPKPIHLCLKHATLFELCVRCNQFGMLQSSCCCYYDCISIGSAAFVDLLCALIRASIAIRFWSLTPIDSSWVKTRQGEWGVACISNLRISL